MKHDSTQLTRILNATGAWVVLASVAVFAAPTTEADEARGLPMPDKLPAPLRSELAVKPLSECRLLGEAHYSNELTGIDVSHYQGNINWGAVASDPLVKYVYLKATEASTLKDSHLERNLRGAKSMHIPVGVYHFFSPTAPVSEQLRNFLGSVKPQDQDLIPIVDVEKRGRSTSEVFHSRLLAFLQQVEKVYGVKPIIYTYMNFYNRHMAGRYRQYKFMIASYSDDVPQFVDDVQMVMWQYTDAGRVSGVHTHVDCSRFMDHYTLKDIMLHR